jgi:peptidyl-prolyl cis-trans isomerase SurA
MHAPSHRPRLFTADRGWKDTVAAISLVAMLPIMTASAQGLRPSSGLGGTTRATPALPLGAPTLAPSQTIRTADYIVAVVNHEPITQQDRLARMERIGQQLERSGRPQLTKAELAREAMESLILEKAQLQLATELGIKVEDAAINEMVANIARQNQLSIEDLKTRLKSEGWEESAFRENVRRQLLIQRLKEREVDARVRVSDVDVDRFVRQKHDNPGSDLQLQLAQILIAVPESADAARVETLRQRAQMVAERARAGADFAALAREFSDAPDKQQGGNMGLKAAERYPALFVNATRVVNVDGTAGPVRSPAGFHILKVLDKQIAGLPDPNIEQTRARHILLRPTAQRTEAQALALMQELRQKIVSGQADFAALAREYSQDGSAKEGGDLGWSVPGMFVPEFDEAMNRLGVGDVSSPVVSRFGVHLIQVQERRKVKLSAREQREQMRQVIRAQKAEEAYVKWLEEIRSRVYVEFRDAPQ